MRAPRGYPRGSACENRVLSQYFSPPYLQAAGGEIGWVLEVMEVYMVVKVSKAEQTRVDDGLVILEVPYSSVIARDGVATIIYGGDGSPIAHLSDEVFIATEVQGEVLKAFKAAHPNARYWGRRWGPGNREYLLWVAREPGGATELELYSDGVTRVISTWGSSLYYDKWEVSPQGQVRYLGSLTDEPRYAPRWLAQVPGLSWGRRGEVVEDA